MHIYNYIGLLHLNPQQNRHVVHDVPWYVPLLTIKGRSGSYRYTSHLSPPCSMSFQ